MNGITFSEALVNIKQGKFARRQVVKNDTVICEYKNRLYHYCLKTDIRFSYTPSNTDLFADDWLIVNKENLIVWPPPKNKE